jgi:ribosomal protein S5
MGTLDRSWQANEVPEAISKGWLSGKKELDPGVLKGTTIPHEIEVNMEQPRLLLKPVRPELVLSPAVAFGCA